MALKITNTCIACAICEPVCPVDAIHEGSEIFEIEPQVCHECKGVADAPLCQEACPVIDCIVPAGGKTVNQHSQ